MAFQFSERDNVISGDLSQPFKEEWLLQKKMCDSGL
jgi:hypothetical protein